MVHADERPAARQPRHAPRDEFKDIPAVDPELEHPRVGPQPDPLDRLPQVDQKISVLEFNNSGEPRTHPVLLAALPRVLLFPQLFEPQRDPHPVDPPRRTEPQPEPPREVDPDPQRPVPPRLARDVHQLPRVPPPPEIRVEHLELHDLRPTRQTPLHMPDDRRQRLATKHHRAQNACSVIK